MINTIKLKILTPIILMIGVCLSGISNAQTANFQYQWNDSDPYLINYVKNNRTKLISSAEFAYNNGFQYREFIEKKAIEYNIPKEIYALAAVESSFNPKAVSSAKAKGMWQFMKGTGLDMGLKVHAENDERHDWKKSTEAAMKYIKLLADDNFQGNYELAVLSYNAGVGKVKRAIIKHQTADVWVLIQDKDLFRTESREYLLRFIAYINYFRYLDKTNGIDPNTAYVMNI
jgi:Soluble lytic murein transglycosylase and related regulatory proteins (some contain LysM/invasin domains)